MPSPSRTYAWRLGEQLTVLSEAERSPFSAEASDILSELLAGPPNSHGHLVQRWRRIESLLNQVLQARVEQLHEALVHRGEES